MSRFIRCRCSHIREDHTHHTRASDTRCIGAICPCPRFRFSLIETLFPREGVVVTP